MLYLHIGTGKAGSTSIQNLIGKNEVTCFNYRQLHSFGLGHAQNLAFASGSLEGYKYWVESRKILSRREFEKNRNQLWNDVESEVNFARKKYGCDVKFVASSEFIFTQYGSDDNSLQILKEKLSKIFGDYIFVLYFRLIVYPRFPSLLGLACAIFLFACLL